jgi:guanine deaminase
MNTHEHFMQHAIHLSDKNMKSGVGGPFGAVIVLNGEIIGQGWNQVTTTYDPTAHAEVVAIRDACRVVKDFSLKGAILYTSCEPCPMCLAATYWARIETIYYANTRFEAAAIGFDDDFLYREIPLPLESRSLPMYRLLSHEAIKVFQSWESKLDKIPY